MRSIMRPFIFLAILCLFALSIKQANCIGLPKGTLIQLVANADYSDSSNTTYNSSPATLTLSVDQAAGVSLSSVLPSTKTARGTDYYVPMKLMNTGNATDSFDLSVTSENGWNVSLVYDDNADSVHQDSETTPYIYTGNIVEYTDDFPTYACFFAKVSVPDDATTGDTVTVKAVSRFDSTNGVAIETLDIPAPGKDAVKLTVNADPNPPQVAQQVTINGSVNPVVQGKIAMTTTETGKDPVSSSLDIQSDGTFTTTFTPSKAGACHMAFSFAETDTYGAGSAGLDMDVEKAITNISVSANSNTPTVGSTLNLSGSITPAIQAALTLSYIDPLGNTAQTQVNTDSNGQFTWSKSIDSAGTWYMSFEYAGSDDYEASSKDIEIDAAVPETPHQINITSGPTLSQTSVKSGVSTNCSISASDTKGYTLSYLWSDGGAGGTFSPSASSQNPTYTPKANATGNNISITISCTVSSSQDSSVSAVGSVVLTEGSIAVTKPTVTSVTPANTATNVALDSSIVITFSKVMNTTTTQSAFSVLPQLTNIVYNWSTDGRTLTITSDGFKGLTDYTCTIGTGACDSNGGSIASAYSWTFTSISAAAFSPCQLSVPVNDQFFTPHIILADPTQPTSVCLAVSVPVGINVDSTTSDNSLACIDPGIDVSSFTSSWDSSSRLITISAVIANPSKSAEIVKSIKFNAPSVSSLKQLIIDGCTGLLLRVGDIISGDFDSDSSITIKDASLFISEWVRWHSATLPAFNPSIDSIYDIAPHTSGTWPSWTPTGDNKIDIKDASAFIECWVDSRSQATKASTTSSVLSVMSLKSSTKNISASVNDQFTTKTSGNEIVVSVPTNTAGPFQADVVIPDNTVFDSSMDSSGNLKNVAKGGSVGTMFFTEYDASTRTVSIAGDLTGNAPYTVAYIRLTK